MILEATTEKAFILLLVKCLSVLKQGKIAFFILGLSTEEDLPFGKKTTFTKMAVFLKSTRIS